MPVLLILSAVWMVLGINFDGFPHFEGDEGIYASRAWAYAYEGTLSAGEYIYDHPPAGWMFIGKWFRATNSDVLFSSLLHSGRFFILLLNALSALFLYKVAEKLTANKVLGVAAALLFVFSPLEVYFGRRILLDNIVNFWMLFSLFVYLVIPNRFLSILLSAVFFAVAVLTKENAVMFLIPYVILVASYKSKEPSARFSIYGKLTFTKDVLTWLLIFTSVVSIYPLMALVRGEFLPSGYFDNGGDPSLLSTLSFQMGRGKSGVFDFENNPFWEQINLWVDEDPILFGLGLFSVLGNLYVYYKKRITVALVLALFIIFQMLFLMRGGIVFEFYILPLVPFFSLGIVFVLSQLAKMLSEDIKQLPQQYFVLFVLPLVLATFVSSLIIRNRSPYTTRSSDAQINAINWIKENVSEDAVIITDSFAKGDLYKKKHLTLKSQFDAEYDPSFREAVEAGETQVDYIIYTKQIEWDLDTLDFVRGILENSTLVESFEASEWDVSIYKTS